MRINAKLLDLRITPCQITWGAALFLLLVALSAGAEPRATLQLGQLPARGQSLLWSPLFQASWDKLNALHGGGAEKVVPPNEQTARLDRFQWSEEKVMPNGAYATFTGSATPAFAKATAARIKEQFGVAMSPSQLPARSQGIAIYSILLRDLNFQTQFFRARQQPLEFKDQLGKSHRVEFFGTTGKYSDRYGNSVRVLGFNGGGKSFVLSIATDREDESLIIYRPVETASFAAAIAHILGAIRDPLDGPYGSLSDGTIHKSDTVKIPYLALETETDFTGQLGGARYYRGESAPWRIEKAIQLTQFELSENGAKLRVETQIAEAPFGDVPEPQRVDYAPRQFVCDRPFFVFAWRKDAKLPYFAMWVDGAELLRPFPRK